MSEKDLGLKLAIRRLFWRMGFSTKVNVPLRAYVPPKASRTREGLESYTDLDVLGLVIGPDLRVQSVIADCKTSPKGSTERMFWIRGVADFFNADDAYMVRSSHINAPARQLAARLGISVLTASDIATLEGYHPLEDPLDSASTAFLFDHKAVHSYRRLVRNLDDKLQPLLEYQELDYWVYEEHRNLQQVVAHLTATSAVLNPSHPAHRAVFFESAWLYTLSLARAVHHIRRTHLSDIDTSLREYLFGGQLGLREKQHLAKVLREAAGKTGGQPDEGVFPWYFSGLLELVTRFARRPSSIPAMLRYAEWLAEAEVARQARSLDLVFKALFDDMAAKLLSDVCDFLVAAAHLNPEFRTRSRSYLVSPTENVADAGAQAETLATKDEEHQRRSEMDRSATAGADGISDTQRPGAATANAGDASEGGAKATQSNQTGLLE